MRIVRISFYLLLIILGISFSVLNGVSVPVNFYFKTVTLPVSLLMVMALGVGMCIGFLLQLSRYWRIKLDCRRMKHQLRLTEQEIKNLRAIPLQD